LLVSVTECCRVTIAQGQTQDDSLGTQMPFLLTGLLFEEL